MPDSGLETYRAVPTSVAETVAVSGSTTPHPESDLPAHLLEIRHDHIAVRAYFKAERRGFAPGRELDDWLTAEQEIDDESRSL